jgi:sulfur carrier protein
MIGRVARPPPRFNDSGGRAAGAILAFLAQRRHRAHSHAMAESLALTVNGEPHKLQGPLTVAGLLASIGLDPRKVAVECREEIVPRSAYATTWLATGDSLEIVHFIGGG